MVASNVFPFLKMERGAGGRKTMVHPAELSDAAREVLSGGGRAGLPTHTVVAAGTVHAGRSTLLSVVGQMLRGELAAQHGVSFEPVLAEVAPEDGPRADFLSSDDFGRSCTGGIDAQAFTYTRDGREGLLLLLDFQVRWSRRAQASTGEPVTDR